MHEVRYGVEILLCHLLNLSDSKCRTSIGQAFKKNYIFCITITFWAFLGEIDACVEYKRLFQYLLEQFHRFLLGSTSPSAIDSTSKGTIIYQEESGKFTRLALASRWCGTV